MSREYDEYLQQHKANVKKGYDWIKDNLPELIPDGRRLDLEHQIGFAHDYSKSQPDEYEPYDAYFYGGNRSYQVVRDYEYAWLLHIHRNPHHWQHWVLIHDDPDEAETILDMPYEYILEMICDWWAFSWSKENLYEIFNWYDEHKNYMKLSDKTRKTVEDILSKMHDKLDEEEIQHSGVKGMKWGVKNGPPYPIKDKEKVEDRKKRVTIKSTKLPIEKFTKYALDPTNAPDKARVFKSALGYTKENAEDLMHNISEHLDPEKLEERGDTGYGMRYQQIMKLKGPNGNEANVLTAWIHDSSNDELRLTSVYVTKKEVS